MLARVTRIAAVALALPLLLTACAQAGPTSSPAPVKMTDCGAPGQRQPSTIQVVCQSDDITARDLRWSAWGKPVATAIGVAVVNLCAVEDCHTQLYNPRPLVIIASKLVSCPHGTRVYSRLQYVFVGHSPFQGVPAHMNFSGFISGAGRPGLPANQTVSLTC
jgi:hypothetical protein